MAGWLAVWIGRSWISKWESRISVRRYSFEIRMSQSVGFLRNHRKKIMKSKKRPPLAQISRKPPEKLFPHTSSWILDPAKINERTQAPWFQLTEQKPQAFCKSSARPFSQRRKEWTHFAKAKRKPQTWPTGHPITNFKNNWKQIIDKQYKTSKSFIWNF